MKRLKDSLIIKNFMNFMFFMVNSGFEFSVSVVDVLRKTGIIPH